MVHSSLRNMCGLFHHPLYWPVTSTSLSQIWTLQQMLTSYSRPSWFGLLEWSQPYVPFQAVMNHFSLNLLKLYLFLKPWEVWENNQVILCVLHTEPWLRKAESEERKCLSDFEMKKCYYQNKFIYNNIIKFSN